LESPPESSRIFGINWNFGQSFQIEAIEHRGTSRNWGFAIFALAWRGRSGEMRGYLKDHVGVFEPDDVVILLAAFDKSWGAVQASGVRYPADKLEFVRAILAKHIIAAAMEGERDVGRLRDGALLALAQSNLRSGPASKLS
jgi:hypothetical protein